MFAITAGFAAGLLHVLSGPDHLAAVAPLAAGRERREWRSGLQWGLGHTSGVVLIGLLLIAFRGLLPIEAISHYSERLVGAALLLVGAWGCYSARYAHDHDHRGQATARASFAMGTLHGLAGSSHFFGVLPALALPTQTAAVLYLVGFGMAAVAGMSAFAAVVGGAAAKAGRHSVKAYRAVLYVCSASAFVVGGFWLVR
jgi:hypothetical protein